MDRHSASPCEKLAERYQALLEVFPPRVIFESRVFVGQFRRYLLSVLSLSGRFFDCRPAAEVVFIILVVGIIRKIQAGIRSWRVGICSSPQAEIDAALISSMVKQATPTSPRHMPKLV